MSTNDFHCQEGLTAAELLRREQQPPELSENLWNPLCVAALNTDPERADAQVFLNVMRDCLAGPRGASDFLLPTVDFSTLFPDPAARFIRENGGIVHQGRPVTSFRILDNGFEIITSGRERFSHLIIAVSPHRLEKLAGHVPQLAPQMEMVGKFEYEPIYSAYLQYPARVRLPEAMIGMRGGLIQWVFDRGRLCQQPGLLGIVISASGDHQSLAHGELAERLHQELAGHFDLPLPEWSQIIAEKRATFAATPQLERPANVTSVNRLFLAGDYTAGPYPATLEAAVRSGLSCARSIMQDDV